MGRNRGTTRRPAGPKLGGWATAWDFDSETGKGTAFRAIRGDFGYSNSECQNRPDPVGEFAGGPSGRGRPLRWAIHPAQPPVDRPRAGIRQQDPAEWL